MSTGLETETCGRTVYTKRGRLAKAFLDSLRVKRAGDLKPGDRIQLGASVNSLRWFTVAEVGPGCLGPGTVYIRCKGYSLDCGDDRLIRAYISADHEAEALAPPTARGLSRRGAGIW